MERLTFGEEGTVAGHWNYHIPRHLIWPCRYFVLTELVPAHIQSERFP